MRLPLQVSSYLKLSHFSWRPLCSANCLVASPLAARWGHRALPLLATATGRCPPMVRLLSCRCSFHCQFTGRRLVSGYDVIRPGGLKLLYLVTQRINGFPLEKIVLSPLGIVEGVTVQQHDKPFHFHASNLFGKNGEALAFKFAVCHRHVNHLRRTQPDLQCAWT